MTQGLSLGVYGRVKSISILLLYVAESVSVIVKGLKSIVRLYSASEKVKLERVKVRNTLKVWG